MSKVYVNSDFIQKRSAALHSTISVPDCRAYYERAKIAESNQTNGWESDVRYFVEQCCNPTNANRYYRQCKYFLEKANERKNQRLADSILKTITERVMLYMEDPGVDGYCSRLTEQQMDALDEAVKKYETADRILNNHEKLSKRFHINSLFTGRTEQTINLEKALIKACAMIDTYDDINPPTKLALTLEEVIYNLQKNRIKYDPTKVVTQITEYFLNRETDISEEHYSGMKTVLEDCNVITEGDMRDISYFTRYHDNSRNTAIQYLNRYMSNPNKNTDTLQEMVESVTLLAKPKDVVNGFGDLMGRIRTHMVCESSIYGMNDIGNSIRRLTGRVIEKAVLEDTYTKSDVAKIRDIMVKESDSFQIFCTESNEIVDYNSRLYDYKLVCERCVRELDGVLEMLYTNYNRDIIRTIQREATEIEGVILSEGVFKFQNLLHLCKKVDEELKARSQKFLKKASMKVKEVKKKLGIREAEEIHGMINSEGRFDVCVERYEIFASDSMNDLHEAATKICKDINNTILCRESNVYCYYLMTDALEFHVECSIPIIMNAEEKAIWENTLSNEDITRCILFDEAVGTLRAMDGVDSNIGWKMQRYFERLSVEEATTLMELASYSYAFSAKTFENLVETYCSTKQLDCLEEARLQNALAKFENKENVPVEVTIEAHYLMEALLESKEDPKEKTEEKKEAPKKQSIVDKIKSNIPGHKEKEKEKDEEGKEEEDPPKKNPFAGINFNSIKLYCAGLKKKLKDMSAKEKEMSRNLDTAMSRLSKSMKDALVSDRREAIIKGSVIPSFSKCIKLSTAVAGIGIISPPLALISVVGGFIMSKKLTKQERLLMLDDIETELEVVDKEIELAQSKNQIKRYRKLLQWKKQLQREYQRIRYNVKIGKDILPGSSTGIKTGD